MDGEEEEDDDEEEGEEEESEEIEEEESAARNLFRNCSDGYEEVSVDGVWSRFRFFWDLGSKGASVEGLLGGDDWFGWLGASGVGGSSNKAMVSLGGGFNERTDLDFDDLQGRSGN
jgi:hypothetical protein